MLKSTWWEQLGKGRGGEEEEDEEEEEVAAGEALPTLALTERGKFR